MTQTAETARPRGPQDIPLSPAEIEAVGKIRWVSEVPHPDGGTALQFGLVRISTPVEGGYEYIEVPHRVGGEPKKVFEPKSSSISGEGPHDKYVCLVYDNLRQRKPITVYLKSPKDITEPINPDRINEIGEFVADFDRLRTQDYESRLIIEGQRRLVETYQGMVNTGVYSESGDFVKRFVEGASIQLSHLEETRKGLPEQMRALVPHSEDLGIAFVQ